MTETQSVIVAITRAVVATPVAALAQLEPAQVVPGPPRHDQGDQRQQEGERDRVARLDQADALRAPRDLDRRR